MSVKKGKWENFKANSSNLNVASPNTGSANIQADWFRAACGKYPININGVSLKQYADTYNKFQTENDVLSFFKEIVLRDFVGYDEEKENAIGFLKKTFHQGGILYPVSSALATKLINKDGDPFCTLSNDSRDSLVNIKTTNTGFKIQEYSEARALVPIDNSLDKYASEDGKIYPEPKKDSLIKAAAVIAIDFSKDSTSPSLVVESNHMEILHEGLKTHLDSRSLGQKIVDFFKSICGLNKVTALSPQNLSRDVPAPEIDSPTREVKGPGRHGPL